MATNRKKSIKLRSNTNYFIPDASRTYNTFSSPYSYQSRQIKIEGYEARLYWQYRYCEDHGGQTFFYTLTYNDRHIPTYYGFHCFDYEDLRGILVGGFQKQLLRKYGTKFKYFVGAELGDGKGERGLANNPHYHILFFLEPADNPRYPYVKISPKDFRHLVREYWQGFDEDTDGFHDYRKAKKGIAREGENDGLVMDYRACMYCAKYVVKDVKLKRAEGKILKYLRQDVYDKYIETEETYAAFYREYIEPNYNYGVSAGQCLTDYELVRELCALDKDEFVLKHRISETGSIVNWAPPVITKFSKFVPIIIDRLDLRSEYSHFVSTWIEPIVHDYIKEYRNRYCNKCRISQGVGDYAFQQPGYDKFSGTIQVPSKKGFKNRPISMYYYRKLFCDVVRDEDNVRYILNADGIQYKVRRLPSQIDRLVSRSHNNLIKVLTSRTLYDKLIFSDVNTQVFRPYSEFLEEWNYLLENNDLTNILQRYAQYKLIYEDRYFLVPPDKRGYVNCYPVLNPVSDYQRFISSVVFTRNPYRTSIFRDDRDKDYLSYSTHPYFRQYIGVFALLDLCADYFFVQEDDRRQKEAEERAAVKRFHDREKLNDFYAQFGIFSN